MVGVPRTETAATSRSPFCTPAGAGASMALPVEFTDAAATNATGPLPGGGSCSEGVVTVSGADSEELLPAASMAATV